MSSRLGYTTTRVSFSSRSVIILLITEIISSFMCKISWCLIIKEVYFNYGFRVYLGDKFDDLVFTRIGYLIDNHKKILFWIFVKVSFPQQFFKT
jgi:hypothetical protein